MIRLTMDLGRGLRVSALAIAMLLAGSCPAAETAPASAAASTTSAPVPGNSVEMPLEQRLERAMKGFADAAIETFAASSSARERWIAGLMLADKAMRSGASDEVAAALRHTGQGGGTAAQGDGAGH